MVTLAQAQERGEEWINGDVPAYQHREVRVREFGLGFVVWAEDRAEGPRSDGGGQRLVLARDSGEVTLWPALPVGEVVRRYEEEYGRVEGEPEPVPAAARVDLNQTSFLLSPPEWLQEAADRLGVGEGAGSSSASSASPSSSSSPSALSSPSSSGVAASSVGSVGSAGESGDPSLPRTQAGVPAPAAAPVGATPWTGTDTNGDGGDDRSVSLPATVFAPPLSGADDDVPPPPSSVSDAKTALMSGGSGLPPTSVAPALRDAGDQGVPGGGAPSVSASVPPSAPAPAAGPVPGGPVSGGPGTPPPPAGPRGTPPPGVPSYGGAQAPGVPWPPAGSQAPEASEASGGAGASARPLAPNAGDIADAATSKAAPPPRRRAGGAPPPPPSAPGAPGVRPGATPPPPAGPGAPGASAGGYVPTQLVSALGPEGLAGPGAPGAPGGPGGPNPPGPPAPPNSPGGTPPGGVHHAATMFADPSQMGPGAPQPPGAPRPPGAPGAPGSQGVPGVPPAPAGHGSAGGAQGAAHRAATMLSGPGGPGAPQPPHAPGAPGVPGAPGTAQRAPGTAPGAPRPPMPPGAVPMPGGMPPGGMPPGAMPPPGMPVPGQPPAYGYPQQGQPTVGPGYQAVLRYRAHDGSEQQLIRRSAPGTPHPEWQIFHELRALNVPPDQVLELHTELESCELPGAYCARMIREQWPQARITSIAPYGTDHASRQQGMRQLLAHQGELHQVADGPARPAPVRAPLPAVQSVPPVPPEAIAQEMGAAFGPGVFRFEQAAVSRQGVPPVVAHTLVVAGLPMDLGPFFWAQAQPGRPVPTLAELAAERGVRPAADAGSYLVMGSDFGRAICVQYGTAHIVAVPVEAGPGGAPVPPQFVNSGLPEFARCLALLGRMWRLRFGLNQEQAGRWTVDFQAQLAALDPAALGSPESWWSVLLEEMWDGLL
ncbi:SUKH-4 family immunity protein [Streptomyces sp. NPDC006622]|uniref:SUKH-4 family immunity protein n=1 Tax=Streptomyces sp. NPDC006622 TaxID=3155459 RepID=UPI0033BEA991